MSESEKRGFFTPRKARITLAAIALSGVAISCTETDPESQIVGGVPGQVETHTWEERCNVVFKCATSIYDYYLGIEQCPQDIEAAKRGEQTQSFNPKIGEIYEGCNYDFVQVSEQTWREFPDGSTIVFEGSPNKKLTK